MQCSSKETQQKKKKKTVHRFGYEQLHPAEFMQPETSSQADALAAESELPKGKYCVATCEISIKRIVAGNNP